MSPAGSTASICSWMFEHVGLPYYGTYFKTPAERLEHDGVMLLHTHRP